MRAERRAARGCRKSPAQPPAPAKGVEHRQPVQQTNAALRVKNAVAPKGVEHFQRSAQRSTVRCEGRSDAERR